MNDDPFKDQTFDDLVRDATRRIHEGLLEHGGPGMRSAVHVSLDIAIRWYQEQEEHKPKTKK